MENKFDSRPFDRELDYAIVCDWWKERKWSEIPLECLPNKGLIAMHNGKAIAAGFLYSTDSAIALLEWIISDPTSDLEVRQKSLDILIEDLCFLARIQGFKKVFTMTKSQRLIDRAINHGFVQTDHEMIHLIKEI